MSFMFSDCENFRKVQINKLNIKKLSKIINNSKLEI